MGKRTCGRGAAVRPEAAPSTVYRPDPHRLPSSCAAPRVGMPINMELMRASDWVSHASRARPRATLLCVRAGLGVPTTACALCCACCCIAWACGSSSARASTELGGACPPPSPTHALGTPALLHAHAVRPLLFPLCFARAAWCTCTCPCPPPGQGGVRRQPRLQGGAAQGFLPLPGPTGPAGQAPKGGRAAGRVCRWPGGCVHGVGRGGAGWGGVGLGVWGGVSASWRGARQWPGGPGAGWDAQPPGTGSPLVVVVVVYL